MSITIEDRIILLLKEQLTPPHRMEARTMAGLLPGSEKQGLRQYAGHGFWEKIANDTGVPSQRWRSVFTRRQKPTPAMIESLAKLWPQYAFWIATGITDAINGHIAPTTALSFPERLHVGDTWSESYFQQAIKLNDQLLATANINVDNDEERLKAVEREWKFGRWREGDLLSVAYDLFGSAAYQNLIAMWMEREHVRPYRLGEISQYSELDVRSVSSPQVEKRKGDEQKRHHDLLRLFYHEK